MDGLQFARLLKQDPATQGIPIIAVTVGGADFERAEALAAGCDAFIIKPLDTRTLSAEVEKVVAEKNGSAAAG